jgi:hypothetical protein
MRLRSVSISTCVVTFLLLIAFANPFSYFAIPAYARQAVAYPTPSIITSNGSPAPLSQRSVIQLGGYHYVFYTASGGANNGYLCYRSSIEGNTWGSENVASHDAISSVDFDVFTDGSMIYVAYPVGAYSIENPMSSTGYVRTGTQTGETITWNTQVPITQASGWWAWDLTQTTNRIYLALRTYSHGYHVEVYQSVNNGSSWTKSFDYPIVDGGWACGIGISSWDFQYTDGVVLVDGEYTEPCFNYWTFNGTEWSAKSTFGSKTGSHTQSNSNYVNSQCLSMVTHGSQIHFAYIPSRSGGPISYQHFTTSWSSAAIVDSSNCMDPSLSSTLSSGLYLFYRIDSTLYYRTMDYYSNMWDSSATTLEIGETSPCYLTSEQYSVTHSVGIVWQGGASSPFDVRFVRILYPVVLTLSLSSPTSLLGFKVSLDGTLKLNESGIENAPIILSYSVTEGQTWNDITLATTSSDGSYSAVWIPSATGTYLIKGVVGNATFSSPEMLRAFSVTSFGDQYVFSVSSNSTLSALAFNSTSRELSFTVSGPAGTRGFVDMAVAKNLVADIIGLKVYLDGSNIDYTTTSTSDSWHIHFTYPHSSHKVAVNLGVATSSEGETTGIDALIALLLIAILAVAVIAVVVLTRRRRQRAKC